MTTPTLCRSEHPDDWGPIRRRCNRLEDHDGPHEYRSLLLGGNTLVDVWEGEK